MKISTQKIAFIAIMSAFCVIGRLGMLALPNVHRYPFHFNLKSAHFNGTVDSLSDNQFFNCLSMCDPTLPFMEKKGSLSESKLSYLPDFCRMDGIFIRVYHLGHLGTFNAWSEFLDLLCQRNSI